MLSRAPVNDRGRMAVPPGLAVVLGKVALHERLHLL
jgi:hypothetical protein